jgi:hypothetical protein
MTERQERHSAENGGYAGFYIAIAIATHPPTITTTTTTTTNVIDQRHPRGA